MLAQVSYPSYLPLHQRGELRRRADAALARLERCDLCPRACGVNRLADERGTCEVGRLAQVSSVGPHYGEEAPLVGRGGSGTVFLSGCNLRCAFCQNAEISQLGEPRRIHSAGGERPGASSGRSQEDIGREVTARQLAAAMLTVQELGCENLNLVTPTHVTAQLLEALCLAVEEGLRVPIVYNCGGYESLSTLALLDGVVDIYMPDLKYSDPAAGERYSRVPDYPQVAQAALREMHRQVGELTMDDRGVARRGLLVRHLVLPEDQAGSAATLRFLAGLSPRTYVNVMAQYRPCHLIHGDPLLDRRPTSDEYRAALETAREAGLTRLDGLWRS
jgi:putative pyruvate formate lyase activating enzyme